MSNRSLLELNHDFWGYIAKEPEAFVKALTDYTNSASPEHAARLEHWGVKVFGMRHHSDGYGIVWGYVRASQPGPHARPADSKERGDG